MANYTTDTWTSTEDSVVAVLALLETQLETLDSTTNPIRMIKIKPLPNGKFIAILNYD